MINPHNLNIVKFSLITLAATQLTFAQEPEVQAISQPAAPEYTAEVKQNASFAFGFRTGSDIARYGVGSGDFDSESFLKGFSAALNGEKPGVSDEMLQAAMASLGEVLQNREKEIAKVNLVAGDKFLAENGKREGVKTLESGLQYEVIEKGGDEKYAQPKEGDAAKQFMVNYRGTTIEGKEFDASPAGQPVPMTLEVIPGFKEALTTMPVGAKWKLFIPSKLAYGEERRSAEISPNTTLIFDLELVKIQDAPAAPEGLPFEMPSGQ